MGHRIGTEFQRNAPDVEKMWGTRVSSNISRLGHESARFRSGFNLVERQQLGAKNVDYKPKLLIWKAK
jgi:hypothetical protein